MIAPPGPPQGQPMQAPQGPPPVTIDAVMALLRDDKMRGFKIDVEADSLVEADQQKDKQQRTEFVEAVGKFFGEFGPVVKDMPTLAPLAGALLQFAVRGFKIGSELEEMIESTMQRAGMMLMNPAPPAPDPALQAKLQIEQAKGQAEIQRAQIEAQKSAQEGQAKMAQIQAQAQNEREKHVLETERAFLDMTHAREKHHLETERADRQFVQESQFREQDAARRDKEHEHKAREHETHKARKSGVKKIERGKDGRIASIHGHDGNVLQIAREGDGPIIGFQAPNGGLVKFARDGQGRIAGVEGE